MRPLPPANRRDMCPTLIREAGERPHPTTTPCTPSAPRLALDRGWQLSAILPRLCECTVRSEHPCLTRSNWCFGQDSNLQPLGILPPLSPLIELPKHIGRKWANRTPVCGFGDRRSTTELTPHMGGCRSTRSRPTIVILCEVFRKRSHHLGATQPLVLDRRTICLSAFIFRWAKRCDYLSTSIVSRLL